jgi:hypothetical protein
MGQSRQENLSLLLSLSDPRQTLEPEKTLEELKIKVLLSLSFLPVSQAVGFG